MLNYNETVEKIKREHQTTWDQSLMGMQQLFGAKSPDYQEFMSLTIKELKNFSGYYKAAHEATNNKKMKRVRHRLRPTLKIFGGEYWCDRLKSSDFSQQVEDLSEMEQWLHALIAHLEEEQKKVYG